jgi:hypothetical protein
VEEREIFGATDDLEFGDFIADGGAAKVYKGTYQYTPVAIKKLKQGNNLATMREGKALIEEAKIMVQLRHANIVRFFALVSSAPPSQPCIKRTLASRPLSPPPPPPPPPCR